MSLTVRPMTEPDRERSFRIFADSYGAGPKTVEGSKTLSLDNRWVAEDGGAILGILRALPFEQAFGGRFVDSVGVAAVGIALDARSRGVGRDFMTGFLQAQHEQGVAMSTLYMSTMAPYRAVGYELAGVRARYQIALEHLPRTQTLSVEPWDDARLDEVDACLRRAALTSNGMIGRAKWWWEQRVFNPLDDDTYLYRYLVQQDGVVTGFIVYTVGHESRDDLPVQWTPEEATSVISRDLCWETPEAAQSLLAFAGAQRALGTNLYWSGPPNDATISFIRERFPRTQSSYQWMSRIVHVSNALEARGYPSGTTAEIAFTIDDPQIQGNAGAYQLQVTDGNARVTRIKQASTTINVRALASMYTGWLSARSAARAGLIDGASDAALDQLDSLFRGPVPWMAEFF